MNHPDFASKIFVKNLKLCQLLMEDEAAFPWFFLIPQRENMLKMMDLCFEDQIQLMREMDALQKAVWKVFAPDQINVAAIGNKTPQLHIHVVGRYKSDPYWPEALFGKPKIRSCTSEEVEKRLQKMQKELVDF